MKTLLKFLTLCALAGLPDTSRADTTVYVDASKSWHGYMNVSELPSNGGGAVFGSGWGVADLNANFTGSVLTLSPNTIGDPNSFWYTPSGGPGAAGNKIMRASLYVEVSGTATTAGTLSGQTVTFTGTVTSNTFTSAHSTVAFIKDFAPDYSSVNVTTVPLTSGAFSISLPTDGGTGRHVQYGFETVGVNVWATDVAPFGSVKLAAIPLVAGNPNVTVNPASPWQGYMNVFNLSDPYDDGRFLEGYSQPAVSQLRASFSGGILTLSPYEIDPVPDGLADSYWYLEDGHGNKNMEANMYVQPGDGTLSGQTVVFSGKVLSHTLTSAHTTIAYIKEFTANYSSFTTSSVVLTPGLSFSISLPISSDPSKHVQYGFQTVGPNVHPSNSASFGSIQINDGSAASPFTTWISGFNFSSFTNPDLTKSGDPDGDGRKNFQEFALNGNPVNGVSSGKVRSRVETVSGANALVITLPVRGAPVFSGSPSKTGAADGVSYTIEGSNGLSVFNQGVTEIPVSSAGMPLLDSGWSYRSFRLDGAIGGATPRGPSGYLRVRTSENP